MQQPTRRNQSVNSGEMDEGNEESRNLSDEVSGGIVLSLVENIGGAIKEERGGGERREEKEERGGRENEVSGEVSAIKEAVDGGGSGGPINLSEEEGGVIKEDRGGERREKKEERGDRANGESQHLSGEISALVAGGGSGRSINVSEQGRIEGGEEERTEGTEKERNREVRLNIGLAPESSVDNGSPLTWRRRIYRELLRPENSSLTAIDAFAQILEFLVNGSYHRLPILLFPMGIGVIAGGRVFYCWYVGDGISSNTALEVIGLGVNQVTSALMNAYNVPPVVKLIVKVMLGYIIRFIRAFLQPYIDRLMLYLQNLGNPQ